MWVDGLPCLDPRRLGPLEPIEVLYEFDGPKIFTALDEAGSQLLCYQSSEQPSEKRALFLVVPTHTKTLDRLKDGSMTVFEILDQPWLWAVSIGYDSALHGAWKVNGLSSVPESARPSKDATLWAHLMPLLSYRMVGEGLAFGTVPASVVAAAVTRPTTALKRLLQTVAQKSSAQGRPENALRALYDLPAQRMAFNSFEVSFQTPPALQEQLTVDGEDPYTAGAASLGSAMTWLKDEKSQIDLELGLLEVLDVLAPPIHGVVTSTELKGRLVGSRSVTITRDDTRRVRQAIVAKKITPELLLMSGRVRELDRDRRTVILRELTDGRPDTVFSFDEEHFDAVFEAFESEALVSVQGRLVGRINEIVALEAVPALQSVEQLAPLPPAREAPNQIRRPTYQTPARVLVAQPRLEYPAPEWQRLVLVDDMRSLEHWAGEFGCTVDELRQTVRAAGTDDPSAVRAALSATRGPPSPTA